MSNTILVVEDDDSMREYCVKLLELAGYAVTVASNAVEALTLFNARTFDLVLTDHVALATTGGAMTSIMKALRPEAEVIVMTAMPTQEDAEVELERGAAAYLAKPFRPGELVAAVRGCLKSRRGAGS